MMTCFPRSRFGPSTTLLATRRTAVTAMAGAARTGEAGAAEDAQPPRRGRPRLEAPSPDFVARREEILSAAVEVFHVKGYDAGTLEDVAEALDLRRASLYYYVRSKAHLLYMIFERALDTALGKLEAYRAIEDPAARLDALIRHQVLMVANEPSLFTVFFDHRPRLNERYEEAIRSRERRYLSTIREVVNDALEAGALPGIEPRY